MKILTLANNKGGVAKTTTTVNVAHGLALMMEQANFKNGRVLVVDTDSQAHATLLLTGSKDHEEENSLSAVLWAYNNKGNVEGALKRSIVTSHWHKNIDVLIANHGMDATEEGLAGRSGNVFYLDSVLSLVSHQYDVILIDTCPKFSLFTKMALLASDDVIIPVAPEYLDSDGLVALINKVNYEREQWRSSKPYVTGIVVVKYHVNVKGHQTILDAIKNSDTLSGFYLGTVPMNSEVGYANTEGQSIFTFNPSCKAASAYGNITTRIANNIFAKA